MAEMKRRKRRSFTPEYRREAARLVIDTGRPIAHVARELDLSEKLLGRWVHAERGREAGQPSGPLDAAERAELIALRRKVLEQEKNLEFLGKAAAYFSRRSRAGRTVRVDGSKEGQSLRSLAWLTC